MQSLFADEPAAVRAVARARAALGGPTLAETLSEPEVGELLDDYDLLWFAPEELDQLRRAGSLPRLSVWSGRMGACLDQSGKARSPSAWSPSR